MDSLQETLQFDDDVGIGLGDAGHRPMSVKSLPRADLEAKTTFFKVLHKKPAALKTMQTDIDGCLQLSDIAVCRHILFQVDMVAHRVFVSLEPAVVETQHGSRLGEAALVMREAALADVLIWEPVGRIRYRLPESLELSSLSPAILDEVFSSLSDANAFPDTFCSYTLVDDETNSLVRDKLQALSCLELKGLVMQEQAPVERVTCWRLTYFGLNSLHLARELKSPKQLLEVPQEIGDDADFAKYYVHQLLAYLESRRWQLLEWHDASSKSLKSPPPYCLQRPSSSSSSSEPRHPKLLYVKAGAKELNKKYLMVLARTENPKFVDTLLRKGIQVIVHFMQPTVYQALLQGDAAHDARQSDALPSGAMFSIADMEVAESDQVAVKHGFDVQRDARLRRVALKSLKLAESFRWGAVRFTWRPLKGALVDAGKFECDCPRLSHCIFFDNGSKTLCTWTTTYRSQEEKDVALRRLMLWSSRCFESHSRKDHNAAKAQVLSMSVDDLPSRADLELALIPADRAPSDVDIEAVVVPKKRRRKHNDEDAAEQEDAAIATS